MSKATAESANHSAKRLLADVGGTNIRLALSSCGDTDVHAIAKLPCAQFDSLQAAIAHYLGSVEEQGQIKEACLAVAGPVNADSISMTNLPWSFGQQALQRQFGWQALRVINDFAAVAHSIPALQASDIIQLGGERAAKNAPILAIGAGTGLGMAMVVPVKKDHLAFPAEGGHATISAQTQQERDIVAYHIEQGGSNDAPCREFFLSGRGLAAIYMALGGASELEPSEISEHALAGVDDVCVQALEVFCGWLGSTCGDQAVSSGALGGVYIAGGMVKQFLPFMQQSSFRRRFEDKGAMRGYLSEIPCYVIQRNHVALLGCAAANLTD